MSPQIIFSPQCWMNEIEECAYEPEFRPYVRATGQCLQFVPNCNWLFEWGIPVLPPGAWIHPLASKKLYLGCELITGKISWKKSPCPISYQQHQPLYVQTRTSNIWAAELTLTQNKPLGLVGLFREEIWMDKPSWSRRSSEVPLRWLFSTMMLTTPR